MEIAYLVGHPPKQPEPEPEPLPPTLDDFLPEEDRDLHVYCIAAPKSGKSELLKNFCWSYRDKPIAVFVLDPAGDMSEQLARLPWPDGRMIFVSHELIAGHSPIINPFQIYRIEPTDISRQALLVKRIIAQQLLDAFQEVLSAGEKSDVTRNMQTVLMPCILTLLDLVGSTIRDLHRFMESSPDSELVKFGRSRHHYPDVQHFFERGFNDRHIQISKDAIKTKLQNLLSTGTFADLTCGKSTIFLEQAWDERKIVIFNLAKGKLGTHESQAFGRLIVSLMQGIAMRKEAVQQEHRITCHLVCDECQNLICPSVSTILSEGRKYKLSLWLAQPDLGLGMSKEMENTVLRTTHLQIAGRTKPMFHPTLGKLFNISPHHFGTLEPREFLAHAGGDRPIRFTNRSAIADKNGAMSPLEWERVQAEQIKDYYRSTAVPVETPTPLSPQLKNEIAEFLKRNQAGSKKPPKGQRDDAVKESPAAISAQNAKNEGKGKHSAKPAPPPEEDDFFNVDRV